MYFLDTCTWYLVNDIRSLPMTLVEIMESFKLTNLYWTAYTLGSKVHHHTVCLSSRSVCCFCLHYILYQSGSYKLPQQSTMAQNTPMSWCNPIENLDHQYDLCRLCWFIWWEVVVIFVMCDTFFQTSYVILYSQLSDSEHIDLVAYTMETYAETLWRDCRLPWLSEIQNSTNWCWSRTEHRLKIAEIKSNLLVKIAVLVVRGEELFSIDLSSLRWCFNLLYISKLCQMFKIAYFCILYFSDVLHIQAYM